MDGTLGDSHALLEAVVEGSADAIFVKDLAGCYRLVNTAAARLFDRPREQVVGKDDRSLLPEDEARQAAAADVEAREATTTREEATTLPGGRRAFLRVTRGPVRDGRGQVVGTFGVARDVTEQKRAEEQARDLVRRLQLALTSGRVGVWDWDIRTDQMVWDDQMLELYGITRDGFPGGVRAWQQGLHPDDRERAMAECQEALEGKRPFDTEFRVLNPNGQVRHVKADGLIVRDGAGKAVRMLGLNREVTAQRRAEEALQASESRYRALFAQSVLGVYLHDVDGRLVDVNQVACEQAGYAREELLRMTIFDLLPKDGRAWTMPKEEILRLWRAWEPGLRVTVETEHQRKDGAIFPVEISTGSLRFGEDRFILAAVQDISARKRSEALLRESERLRRLAMETGRIGAFEVDLSSGRGRFTPEVAELWGLPAGFDGDFLAHCWRQVHPDDLQGVRAAFERMLATGEPHAEEFRVRRGDGTVRWVRWQAQSYHEPPGPVRVVGVSVDVTSRRVVEVENEQIFELTPALLCTARPDGTFEKVNREWSRVLGFTREEVLRSGVLGLVHPEDRARTEAEIARQRAGGATAAFVNRYRCKDGGWRTLEWTAGPALDGRLYACARDITERLQAEEERARLQAQLHQAQKMEALGTLAGGVAHDFNNILNGVMSGLSLLELEPPLAAYLSELSDMKALAQRGTDLTRQMLGIGRRGKYDVRPHDLGEVVRKTTAIFGRTRRDVVVELDFAPGLPAVLMDHAQLEQVLLNLFVNAGHAMPEGGTLRVRAACVQLPPERAAARGVAPGRFLELVVADDGVGMDAATKAHLFEPFFTTKPPGQGTGLGLASVYGIVRHHGGAVAVESEPNKGAAFTILLPASDQPLPEKAAPRAAAATAGHGTLLLVDDEEDLLRLNALVLRTLGYEVLTAPSGRAAVELARKHRGSLSLVILDFTMPQMGGAKTFEALREVDPEVKVLLCSGFAEDEQIQKLLARGCCGFLQKPFDRATLAATLKSVGC